MISRWFEKSCALLVLMGTTSTHAACLNPAAPAESPVQGVEMFLNIHLDLPDTPQLSDAWGQSIGRSRVDRELLAYPSQPPNIFFNVYSLTGESPGYGSAGDPRFSTEPINEGDRGSTISDWRGFTILRSQAFGYGGPVYVWPNHVDPAKLDQKKFEAQGGAVYFYEPDGKGARRVCRMERWESRTLQASSGKLVPRQSAVIDPTAPAQSRNPRLAELGKQYFLVGYTNIEYDAQGRVPRIGPVCYFYRPDGQVRLVRFATEEGRCVDATPDPAKERFVTPLFDAKGKAYGAEINEPWKWEPADDKTRNRLFRTHDTKGWKRFAVLYNEALDEQVSGLANDRSGTYQITAVGKTPGFYGIKDDNRYNQWQNRIENLASPKETDFNYAKGSSRIYRFPYAVQVDLIRHPEKIYDHERVRVTGIFSGMALYERFTPGPNNIVARVWKADGTNNVPRQEFFENGKRVRALLIDYALKEENHLLWDEDLERYKSALKMPLENIYMRIYDYDASDKEKLVAVGWTDYPRRKFYAQFDQSKRAMWNQTKDSVKRLVGMNVPKPPAELTYAFATLDGKLKWSDEAEFIKWATRDGKYRFQGQGSETIFPDGNRTTGD